MHRLLAEVGPSFTAPANEILAALQSYCGQVIDLERNRAVGGAELGAASETFAQWLSDLALLPGDRVVFSVGNGPAFTAALCGVIAAGGTPLLLHGDTPSPELFRYAQQYSARFVLSQHATGPLPVARERSDFASSSFDWLTLQSYELPLDAQSLAFPSLSGVTLHPTSGSTGRAKIAVRTAQQTIAEARHYIDTMQITADDRILCVVPMSHAYGFGMGFMVSLLSGASLITVRQFNPRTIARVLAEQHISIFPAVPAMLDLIVRAGTAGASLPRLVLAAGAPLTEETAAAFQQLTGTAIAPLFGTTETGGITVAVGEENVMPSGCVGRPMQGVGAQVTPIENAAQLPVGVGRVVIRSSSMMSGYLTPDGVDSSAIRDGWFETGDLGRIDTEGRIQLVGREKEIINVFGLKVIPSEVEEVIAAIPGVREVKAYAGKHRSGSDIIKVAFAVDGDLDVEKVRAYCEANLPPFKRPQMLRLLDALPRSSTGKILRDELP